MHPRTVLAPSILVACVLAAVLSACCALIAWFNSQPRIIAQLSKQMHVLEADRGVWLVRMESFAAAAGHDLELAAEHKTKAQNTANRNARREAGAANGPQPPAPVTEEQLLAQTAEYWRSR